MPIALTELCSADLPDAVEVLAAACRHDRAAAVAREKLFGRCPRGVPRGFSARSENGIVGVAATCCDRVRLVAVHPEARNRGTGSRLLAVCEAAISSGFPRVRILDEPGNYLAPGVDEENRAVLRWLERRGYQRGESRTNLLVAVRDNPGVTADRAAELAATAARRGYEIRRVRRDERVAVVDAVGRDFGRAWAFEVERAIDQETIAVHGAWYDGELVGFAAHDGNNRGLGWFGPAGTLPVHRGRGLGEAILVACLVDIATRQGVAEIAWIGPRRFYERAVGVIGERRFVAMTKDCGMVAT